MKMFTVIACFVLSIPGVFASPTPLELEAKKLEKRYCRTGGEVILYADSYPHAVLFGLRMLFDYRWSLQGTVINVYILPKLFIGTSF
ncbi:hypothetical protein FRC08_013047 [Ceratobasidium sp. 394]|nr:hypothetical protein FRC08_013047 [Ceratobasidium sp. 394]